MMDIDRPRNKRSRDEQDLDAHDNHCAKRTRIVDDSFTHSFAGAHAASSPSASSDMDMDSAASTPSAMEEDTTSFFAPAPQSTFQQPQSRSTIISGLNQARRTEDLRITCPWLFT
ncbi:hypothetical protein QBC39DRAFT_368676 [Podospora conica]|nr:hypothetical protein QBC39DRAFT_368676 [Schizothecium conicum]